MKRTQQKINSKKRPRVRIRLGSIFILCFTLAVVGSSGWELWKLRVQVEGQLDSLNQKRATLLQQKKQLNEEIVKLNTPSYIEQLAREQLGLVKDGEIAVSPKK